VFERHISWVERVVWGTVGFFEACEFLSHLHLHLEHSTKVPSREDTVVRDGVIKCGWLIVMVMLEAGSIRMTEDEWHEGISIIDSIELLAFKELSQIVLKDGSLAGSSGLGSGSVNTDAITESENVLESLVLESVWVHINNTLTVGNT
jgi:hypothetical protein